MSTAADKRLFRRLLKLGLSKPAAKKAAEVAKSNGKKKS